jgi:hypothetical protein
VEEAGDTLMPFIEEEYRKPFRHLGPKAVFNELVEDALIGHATALFRFSAAISFISKKWRMTPEQVFVKFEQEVRATRPQGPPVHPPIEMAELLNSSHKP